MKLELKKAFKDVVNLKYFVPYLFIFAVISAISAIFSGTSEMQNNVSIGNIISVLTYISLGYLFIMVNNLLNNKEENSEETFWASLWNSTKKGFKGFVAIAINTILLVLIVLVFVVGVVFVCSKTGLIKDLANITQAYNWLMAIVVVPLAPAVLFALKFLLVVYSEKFSIKDTFHWIKICKNFFNKDKFKETLAIIGLYILVLIVLGLLIFGFTFILNLIIVLMSKYLLQNHYVALTFMINISSVILPFIFAMLHYTISGVMFILLANVYKKEN